MHNACNVSVKAAMGVEPIMQARGMVHEKGAEVYFRTFLFSHQLSCANNEVVNLDSWRYLLPQQLLLSVF